MSIEKTFDHSDSKRDLSKYYCKAGSDFFAVWKKSQGAYMCCPEWLGVNLQEFQMRLGVKHTKYDQLKDAWFGENAQKIKHSLLDGSFKYCNYDCPHLQKLKYSNLQEKDENFGTIAKKDLSNENGDEVFLTSYPKTIFINFDQSCNLSCPSCRPELIKNGPNQSEELMRQIDRDFADHVERFHCTGAGDPFYSRIYREWMMDLDIKKYKKLTHFFIHTNGQMWTRELWLRMPALHQLFVTAEISIDAATQTTYEIVRRGGSWERLQKNLSWLSNDPQLKNQLHFSFVVQKINHEEMIQFVEVMRSLFPYCCIEFRKLQKWERTVFTADPLKYAEEAIHLRSHRYFEKFYSNLKYIEKTYKDITHNFHDI